MFYGETVQTYLGDGEKPVDDKKTNKWKGRHLKSNFEDCQGDTQDLKNKELIEEIHEHAMMNVEIGEEINKAKNLSKEIIS